MKDNCRRHDQSVFSREESILLGSFLLWRKIGVFVLVVGSSFVGRSKGVPLGTTTSSLAKNWFFAALFVYFWRSYCSCVSSSSSMNTYLWLEQCLMLPIRSYHHQLFRHPPLLVLHGWSGVIIINSHASHYLITCCLSFFSLLLSFPFKTVPVYDYLWGFGGNI